MNRLLEFIKKYNYWFLFVLLEIIGIIMLFRFNNYQASVYLTSANAVSGKLYDMSSAVTSYADVKEQNRELTRQNILLERQVAQLRLKLEKINGDKEYVDSKEKAMASLDGYTLLDAQVINATTSKVRNYLTINKGYKDGVKPEMGVVGGRGVIGIVYLTSAHYSLVIPLLNEKSNVSCRIRDRGYFGTLTWSGGNTQTAWLNDIPRHARFKVGDYVVTSGFSSVFPEGMYVGKIEKVYYSADGLSYQCLVRLGTDFGKLRDVNVLLNPHLMEHKAVEDSARIADLKEIN